MADVGSDGAHDIATIPGVSAYIAGTAFDSKEVQRLSGGFANYTFRLHLLHPFEGQTTVVLKHSKDNVLSSVTNTRVSFSLVRQKYEAEALTRVRAIMPSDLIATTPRVFHLDEAAGVTIMEDCGPGTTTLKQLILDHQLSNLTPSLNESFLAQAGRIGVGLGRFAGVLHGWGRKDEDRSAIEMFSKHQEGRTITGWATYGRLISTLTGLDGLPMLKDPPFEVSRDKLDVLAKIAEERQRQIMEANETMTHGDFWPGNILVNMQREGDEFVLKRIFIVDWELVKPGIKGADLGQFCAELHLLRQFHKGTTDAVKTILQTFLETYNQFHKIDIALSRVANAHMGAHLVGWLPRVPWGEKDRVREVVAEGVEDLVQAYSGPDDWLADSVIPPM